MHQPLPPDAMPRSASITRKGGRWFVNIAIESASVVETHAGMGSAVGIDAGIEALATLSDGARIQFASPGRELRAELRRSQRALARCHRGSKRREKVRARLRRLHEHVASARNTHLHTATALIAKTYPRIYVEDLRVANMMRSARGTVEAPGTNVAAKAGLNRSLADAGMSKFITMQSYKAERSGGRLIKVDARNTSQDCSGCGERVAKPLAQRMHRCPSCGLAIDRDWNAARNILARGLAKASEGV